MSKFSGLRGLKNTEDTVPAVATPQVSEMPATQNDLPKKLGRPRAKRSNPDFVQVSGYIPKNVYLAVKWKMLDQGGREFSEVLKELLSDYAREFIK